MSYGSQRGQEAIIQADEHAIDSTTPLSRTDTAERAPHPQHSLANRYRRPSNNAAGPRTYLDVQVPNTTLPGAQDREAAIDDERDLLIDNHLLSRKRTRDSAASRNRHGDDEPSQGSSKSASGISKDVIDSGDQESGNVKTLSERTPLLATGRTAYLDLPDSPSSEDVDMRWEEAVLAGKIKTTWQRETKTILKYTGPLLLTFVLQNSLTFTSLFMVGHIDKIALAAVSLGAMTVNITGMAVINGLATALDTLCAQAYGSGKKKLVGLQAQRMLYFLWVVNIPVMVVWFFGNYILGAIVPEKDVAELAGIYLKIIILALPAYSAFEAFKRFVIAQGNANATMYVLLICSPLNIFLQWLFVWRFGWGFIGCPLAIAITVNLMALLLFLYIRLTDSSECWPGFSRQALKNWWPMIRLALPGLLMVLAEYMAFEILTLSSAYFGATTLAAQAILQNLSVQTYMLPFPISIAASMRVANLIGASLPEPAKVTARVTFVFGAIAGLFNMILLSSARYSIPPLFTSDEEVIELAAAVLPINAAFQLFDALAAQCNGVLRGLGRQEVGGLVAVLAYYCVAIPLALGLGFGLKMGIYGLWIGPLAGLGVQSITEGIYIYMIDWNKASEEAEHRNAAE